MTSREGLSEGGRRTVKLNETLRIHNFHCPQRVAQDEWQRTLLFCRSHCTKSVWQVGSANIAPPRQCLETSQETLWWKTSKWLYRSAENWWNGSFTKSCRCSCHTAKKKRTHHPVTISEQTNNDREPHSKQAGYHWVIIMSFVQA